MVEPDHKYLEFTRAELLETGKTQHWSIRSKSGSSLGYIKYRPAWRCYVFYPGPSTLFNTDCLNTITEFCDKLTIELKEGWK